MDDLEAKAAERAAEFGLHPKRRPMGDDHHTDAVMESKDWRLGNALAWYLGTNYADIEDFGNYFNMQSTPIDEWSRIVRALRIHGLKIVDDK